MTEDDLVPFALLRPIGIASKDSMPRAACQSMPLSCARLGLLHQEPLPHQRTGSGSSLELRMAKTPKSIRRNEPGLFSLRLSTSPGYVLLGGGRESRPLLVLFAWGDSLERSRTNICPDRESIANAVREYGKVLRSKYPDTSFAINLGFPARLYAMPVLREAGFNGFGQSNYLHLLPERPHLPGRWSQKQFPTDMTLSDADFRKLTPS